MKKILLFVLTMSLVLTGCTKKKEDTSLKDVMEKGYIILGLDDTFAPMGFKDNDGNTVGFDVDLAKAVADELGIELRLQTIDWDAKVLELNSGNIDMIWNGLSITDERLKTINFSQPYINNRQIIIVKDGLLIDNLDDLSQLKVGVQIGSSGQNALQNNSIYTSIGEMVQFNTFTEALMDLEAGRIDTVVIDEIMGRYIVSKDTFNVVVTDVSLGNEQYGIGFRLGDDSLRAEVDKVLNKLADDGKTAEISNKWFKEDIFRK